MARRTGPVLLSTTAHFRRELRVTDEVDVTCVVKFGAGKTFTLEQTITKADGTLSAEVSSVLGVLDLDARKLFADPRAVLESAGLDLSKVDG
jgi:acyl-CoA thioester hydrolase